MKTSTPYETGMKFVQIPYKPKPFLMSIFPVTQKTWEDIMGYNHSYFKGSNKPVIDIELYQAEMFCEKTGFSLPTKEQQEFAMGKLPEENPTDYYWDEKLSVLKLHDVGGKLPNKYGLYDMFNNIIEYTLSEEKKDEGKFQGGCFSIKQNILFHKLKYENYPLPKFGFRIIY